MRALLFAFLFLGLAQFSIAGILNDSDIPGIKAAVKKSYNVDLCHGDIPDASAETCQCIGEAIADALNTENLKACQKEGYDECVAKEVGNAKSNLSEKQINDCKKLTQ